MIYTYMWSVAGGTYELSMEEAGTVGTWPKIKMRYAFRRIGEDDPIFQGDDFQVSPMDDPGSRAAALSLLTFLCLKPGDTDEEYFKDYTPRQWAWVESGDIEELDMMRLDEEEALRHISLVDDGTMDTVYHCSRCDSELRYSSESSIRLDADGYERDPDCENARLEVWSEHQEQDWELCR